jgi:hypothetical protein
METYLLASSYKGVPVKFIIHIQQAQKKGVAVKTDRIQK